MFAVIKTGGKQYRVAANDQFEIERLPGVAGDSVTFAEVLMVGTTIGAPFVAGASVIGEIVEQSRGKKVISFKKRRRQNSKRTRGHRQELTVIRIGEILTDGKAPSEKAAKTSKAAAKADDADAPVAKTDAEAEKPRKAAKAKVTDAEAPAKPAKAGGEAPAAKKPRAAKKKVETDEA